MPVGTGTPHPRSEPTGRCAENAFATPTDFGSSHQHPATDLHCNRTRPSPTHSQKQPNTTRRTDSIARRGEPGDAHSPPDRSTAAIHRYPAAPTCGRLCRSDTHFHPDTAAGCHRHPATHRHTTGGNSHPDNRPRTNRQRLAI